MSVSRHSSALYSCHPAECSHIRSPVNPFVPSIQPSANGHPPPAPCLSEGRMCTVSRSGLAGGWRPSAGFINECMMAPTSARRVAEACGKLPNKAISSLRFGFLPHMIWIFRALTEEKGKNTPFQRFLFDCRPF